MENDRLTRRGVLQRAGGFLAATALPAATASAAPAAAESVSQVTSRLSAYMSEAGGRTLPAEVV